MAQKKSGNGSKQDLTIRVLQKIQSELSGLRGDVGGLRDELRELNQRVDGLNQRVDGLNQRVDGLESATIRGFELVTARLENIRDFAGEQYRGHDHRIASLEERLARLEERPPE